MTLGAVLTRGFARRQGGEGDAKPKVQIDRRRFDDDDSDVDLEGL